MFMIPTLGQTIVVPQASKQPGRVRTYHHRSPPFSPEARERERERACFKNYLDHFAKRWSSLIPNPPPP